MPNGIRLVPGSLSLNGVSLPSANPDAGVYIGNLDAGSSITVSFQVLVESVPTSATAVNESRVSYRSGSFYGQSVSNSVVTSIYQSVIEVTKSTTVANAVVGLPVPFTMVLRNTGSLPANVVLRDPLPSQTAFVTGSVLVNGGSRPEASPVDGIELGSPSRAPRLPSHSNLFLKSFRRLLDFPTRLLHFTVMCFRTDAHCLGQAVRMCWRSVPPLLSLPL